MTIDENVVVFDGIWDLSEISQPNKVAYTSLITKSSGAVELEEFKNNYLYVGTSNNQLIYVKKDYYAIPIIK